MLFPQESRDFSHERFKVEDDLSLIKGKGLSFSLEKEGHTVTLGKTYREALLKWEEDHYDLVILDVSLQKVSQKLGNNYQVLNVREQNTTSTYLAFNVFIYGFLLIIGAVTFLNIINSISLSVSARLSQFATMRAVGMEMKQVSQVILAEAMSYGVVGGIVGCGVGVWLNKFLFDHLIGNHFAYAQWHFPIGLLAVVFVFVMLSVLTAVYFPVKRIEQLSVTEHLNEV